MHPEFTELLQRNSVHARQFKDRFGDVQAAQRPKAVTVCCSDSRVLQDHMWGNDTPGRLFTCSNIGNRAVQQTSTGEVVSGDVLYPVLHTGTNLVIIVGHTGCGAITTAYDDLLGDVSEPAGITSCLELLTPPLEEGVRLLPSDLDRGATVNRLVEYNVDRQVERLETSEHISDQITVIGVVYDFQDVYSGTRGEVHIINIDGETSVDKLQEKYPEFGPRIERLWEY